MVKVEGVYRGFRRIGQELLTDERQFELVMGNGNKEAFFRGINEDIDFSFFLHHLNWAKSQRLRGYTFINIKPSTLLKYAEEIKELTSFGKVVVEIREDSLESLEMDALVSMREDFPFLLSLDDMGRGASNLDRVMNLHPNFIKVDMKLFRSPSELTIFTSFLKKYAPRSVLIAEKVETERELKMARGAGIEIWSGWYERKLSMVAS